MTERVWSETEIAALQQSEPQLAAKGMYTTGELGDYNANVFLKYFELHPEVPVTVDILFRIFEALKGKNLIHVKGEAQLRFEKAAQKMSPQELEGSKRSSSNQTGFTMATATTEHS